MTFAHTSAFVLGSIILTSSSALTSEDTLPKIVMTDNTMIELRRAREPVAVRYVTPGQAESIVDDAYINDSYSLVFKAQLDAEGTVVWRKEHASPKDNQVTGWQLDIFDYGFSNHDNGRLAVLYADPRMIYIDMITLQGEQVILPTSSIPVRPRSASAGPWPRGGRLFFTRSSILVLIELNDGVVELWEVRDKKSERLWTGRGEAVLPADERVAQPPQEQSIQERLEQ